MHREAQPSAADPMDIAKACYLAYVSNDRGKIESLLASGFHFTSPLDNRIDRKTYFERCWPNNETISGFDFIHLAQAGEQVFVTYEGRGTDGRTFRNTEVLTIRDSRIHEAEVYFGWNVPHEAPAGGSINPSDG